MRPFYLLRNSNCISICITNVLQLRIMDIWNNGAPFWCSS